MKISSIFVPWNILKDDVGEPLKIFLNVTIQGMLKSIDIREVTASGIDEGVAD